MAAPRLTAGGYYVLKLTTAQRLALVDCLVEYLGRGDMPREFAIETGDTIQVRELAELVADKCIFLPEVVL